MKISIVGGGPAGLYFSILMKKLDPSHQIEVLERNKRDETFGFGVVFSDATMENIQAADPPSYEAITSEFYHWDDIDIHYRGEVLTSTGHGFAGLSRQTLLRILAERAEALGVVLRFETETNSVPAGADLVVVANGLNSQIRDDLSEKFEPRVDLRPNRFVWLGTSRPFPAFSFFFATDESGLWRVHAYQYEDGNSTFIVEATEETFRASGLDENDEEATVRFCEALFADVLGEHRLIRNKSVWRQFPTIQCEKWYHDNIVLVGDAVHTAHFSIGSGTKLAMEDAISLQESIAAEPDLPTALAAYEADRKAPVVSLQRAAQASLEWFEETERYTQTDPVQFGFSLLTRSMRITHEELKVRDPKYVATVDRWFAEQASAQSGVPGLVTSSAKNTPPPPLFTPFKLRELLLPNRVVVSAMCQYSAELGEPNDWHFTHITSRAVGGAGLVMTEMTDVSPEGRITHGCTGLYAPEHTAAWRRIVDFVHRETTSKIGIQLAHAGRKGATKLAWDGYDQPLEEDAWPILAPSPLPFLEHSAIPKEMDRADMDKVRDDFVRSAELAEEVGFDILELHFAHGYLLSTFISPLTNRRTDQYGGSLENRMRFPLEVLSAVRAVWPEDKPISVRVSATDWAPGGIEGSDAVEVAAMLKARGCDIVDVSAGQVVPYAKPKYGRLFQTPFSDRIRHEVEMPTMAVGAISSYTDVNTILAAGRADLCAIARMHLWDPYWTRHAAHELGYELPWPKPYSVLDGYTPRFD